MIPNICHFVFGFKEQNEEFLFCYYLAVYSAYIVNKPDKINFFYHHEPHGPWWEKLKKIPCIFLVHIPIPTHIGKKIIKKVAHKADWIRMNVLYQYGGIYLDIDSICIKPWKDLLKEKVVLATQIPIPGICNAIMMTEPQSEFFKIWLDRYEGPFNPDGWEESSIFLPLEIMITNFDKVTMKNPDTFFIPHFKETEKIFVLPQEIPKNLVALHLWESYTIPYMKKVKNWDWCFDNKHTLYGKIMINLLENYILNDPKVFVVQKKNFIQNNNYYTCNKDTILRKNLSLNTLFNDIAEDKCTEGENLNPIFSSMEDFLIIEKLNNNICNNKNLHIIHRIDMTNTGDMISSCHNYYDFPGFKIIKHDIYNPDFSKIEENDKIILSGGGLLNCLEIWNQNINKLLELSENVIGWGIGLNKHNNTEIKTEINFNKFRLLGIRDYNVKLSDHTEYVPCSSCKLPHFNNKYEVRRKIAACEHHEKKINLPFEKINNEAEISEIIRFIGETDIVLSNTYHCLYFSLLMNKKSILYKSFSEKFNNLKYKFKTFNESLEIEEDELIFDNGNPLAESIEINDNFYKKVLSSLNF
jgi:hypothetical protein